MSTSDNSYPSISIIISTLNREAMLAKTLESLQWLSYRNEYEVVVVNGPSTDHTEEVVAKWRSQIKYVRCPVANLSVSRNIGICHADADVVAFIDDDAIPEPEWLQHLAEPYLDPGVGGVGGLVYNHTGYEYQYKYCTVNRFGDADLTPNNPTPQLSFPKSYHIPHLLGCNSSFRRSALLEIGGFDEEFEYYLDETDVCFRIIDAGYEIVQLSAAHVHHKYAPSNIRGQNRVVKKRYPIIKNKIYFMHKHAREYHSLDELIAHQTSFIKAQKEDMSWCLKNNFLSELDYNQFLLDIDRGLEVGSLRGLEGPRAIDRINLEKIEKWKMPFRPFRATLQPPEERRCIVLISKHIPPLHTGGIALFSLTLAESLASLGHIVHLITSSDDINRVDFENGVWLHRILIPEVLLPPKAQELRIPSHIWSWSASALAEACRIAGHRPIDVVEAPIWDCEGIAFLLQSHWPLVTSLHTTLALWLQSHQQHRNDHAWMDSFGTPMLELEMLLMQKASAVRVNSKALVGEIEKAYNFRFPNNTVTIYHGLHPQPHQEPIQMSRSSHQDGSLEVLFVGRLEPRKGIDVLIKAIPFVLEVEPRVCFRIIGDDTDLGPHGISYKRMFRNAHTGRPWLNKVAFDGLVSDSILQEAYANCDIFVAPSRFESFGLVFLEAMRFGKPVIGCLAGGIPEVVSQDVNGLLVPPGDSDSLAKAILHLIRDPQLRAEMGKSGHRLFKERFSSMRMATDSLPLYDLAADNYAATSH